MIDKSSPIPIYHQLEAMIRAQIAAGELRENEIIPSEREFVEKYQISRMTIRQALANLVNDGTLSRRKGVGTFVNPRKVEQGAFGMTSFTEDMLSLGMTPHSEIIQLSKVLVPIEVATALGIHPNRKVWQVERKRWADDQVIGFERAFIPLSIADHLPEEAASHSIYDFIQNSLGLTIERAVQVVEATKASASEAELLEMKRNEPVLHITRTSYLSDGRAFEYVKSTFRADRYKIIHQMSRGK